jgi:hypothetical protein
MRPSTKVFFLIFTAFFFAGLRFASSVKSGIAAKDLHYFENNI